MKTKTIVRDEGKRALAIKLITEIPLDKPHVVIIKPHSESLSDKQRGLYWKWMSVFIPEMADNKDAMHLLMKEKFLVKILIRENSEYRAMTDAIIACRVHSPEQAEILRKAVIDMTSIRDSGLVTTKIMAEFMDCVFRFGADFNVRLPRPDDDLYC